MLACEPSEVGLMGAFPYGLGVFPGAPRTPALPPGPSVAAFSAAPAGLRGHLRLQDLEVGEDAHHAEAPTRAATTLARAASATTTAAAAAGAGRGPRAV